MTVRIAHLSDIHFGGENVDAVEAALQTLADLEPQLVLVTGDLTLNGLPREFEAARLWLSRLAAPLLVTPGNHDTPYWNLPLRALRPFDRYRRFIGQPNWSAFDGGQFSVRAVNSARGFQLRPNWSKGALDVTMASRAAAELAGRADALKVFACHHPLIDLPGMPVTGGVHRGAQAAAALAEAGVDLILTGHTHTPFAVELKSHGRPAYAIGAGTLSLRTRGAPPSFMTIEAGSDFIEVVAVTWTGKAFRAGETWRLRRIDPVARVT